MIKKIAKPLFLSFVLSALLLGGYSCATDDYLSEREIQDMIDESLEGQWKIVNITVNKNEWEWNDRDLQWQAIADLPQLTPFIYEKGAQLGYVFIRYDDGSEVQKLLPYVDTYGYGMDENNELFTFTETISVDYQLGTPSTVAFFIKDSQLVQDLDAPRTLQFRIVLVY